MSIYEDWKRFAALFQGLDSAFGYNSSPPRWIKRAPRAEDWIDHLTGRSPGIGIAPLRPDNTVMFAAIDLDEPDFDAAREMQLYIPGPSFIERSKSGNAHVWVFFREPLEAWVAMGMLREATLAAGKAQVEVFPKNFDFNRVTLGNYINLPFHGDERPILCHLTAPSAGSCGRLHPPRAGGQMISACAGTLSLAQFLDAAEERRNDAEAWRNKAKWLQIMDPAQRRDGGTQHGEQPNLHICAMHVIENAETNPIAPGHRNAVYFALAKQLTNWRDCDHDEALEIMQSVNEAAPRVDRVEGAELLRILGNAERGMYTSTGCDDPLFAPYAHPDCPIANPRRSSR